MPDPTLRDLPPEVAYQLACECTEISVYGPWTKLSFDQWERRSASPRDASKRVGLTANGVWIERGETRRRYQTSSAAMAAADAALRQAGAILVGGVPEE